MNHPLLKTTALCALCLALLLSARAGAEVYLQYFETNWDEIRQRLPEAAMYGYAVLWLPPPGKGCEGKADPGYSVYDRFDLGDRSQRGTTATRYGTRAELVKLTKEVHHLGGKVIFDVVMNHNGNPARIENTHVTLSPVPIDQFPHTRPLDYHLLPGRTYDGGTSYEVLLPADMGGQTTWVKPLASDNPEKFVAAVKMPSGVSVPGYTHLVRAPWTDYSTSFKDQNYSLLGLIDFATEQHINSAKTGVDTAKDGKNNLNGLPLPVYVRQPSCTECYPDGKPVAEDIRTYLHRWIWWLGKVTDADGYRLDAIKHVPTTFFAYDFTGDKLAFNKTIQDDYDKRRGYTDAYDQDDIKDAIIFGESYTGISQANDLLVYRKTGMKLLNFPLMFNLLDIMSNSSYGAGDIGKLSYPHGGDAGAWIEYGGLGRDDAVHFAHSHDQAPPDLQEDLAFAFILTRPGDAVVFFDGNNYDAKSWVTPGRADALGDVDSIITELVYIHNHYGRGGMHNRFVDDDAYVYERVVKGKGAVLLVVLHDNIGSDSRVGPDGVASFGAYDPRPLVVTAFPPKTKLTELTGNSAVTSTTVLDPASLPSWQVAAAQAKYYLAYPGQPLPAGYGLVSLSVPSGPTGNYAAYGVAGPSGPSNGARAVEIWQAGQRVADTSQKTVGERRTYTGVRIAEKILTVPEVTGKKVDIKLRVTSDADAAYLQLNAGGVALGGVSPVSGSVEGLSDGYVPMKRTADISGDRTYSLANVDVAALVDGNHIVRVRAVRNLSKLPPVFTTFYIPFVVDRSQSMPTPTTPEDEDGDGFKNAADNCPKVANPGQADFDVDQVGDMCDLCPLTHPSQIRNVDADGCKKIDPKKLTGVDAIIGAITGSRPSDPKLDLSADGQIDVWDLVLEVNRIHETK